MNKTEMAMKLAKKTGVSQGKAAEIIDTMFSAHPRKGLIATALDAGEKVTIPGFGTFATKQPWCAPGPEPGDRRHDHDSGEEVRALQARQDPSRARREVEDATTTASEAVLRCSFGAGSRE